MSLKEYLSYRGWITEQWGIYTTWDSLTKQHEIGVERISLCNPLEQFILHFKPNAADPGDASLLQTLLDPIYEGRAWGTNAMYHFMDWSACNEKMSLP